MKRINAFYFIKEGLKNTFTQGFMGIASIAILLSCLVIIGIFLLTTENIDVNLQNIEEQDEIVAFVDEILTIEEAQDLKYVIDAVPHVKDSIFVSNTEALHTFEGQLEGAEDIMAELESDNPLRHSFRIFVDDIENSTAVADAVKMIPGIIKVRHNEFVTNNIISLRKVFSIAAFAFFIILLALSVFIIYNTIRLATVARRKEINIMKFVGATNWFIRWPFVIEGLIIGLVAATLAYFCSWYLYTYFVDNVFEGINIVKLLDFNVISGRLAFIFYAVGIVVGVAGSAFAMRKYLRV